MWASWKTTVFGLIGGVGAAILALYLSMPEAMATLPAWVKAIAAILSAIGTTGLGLTARDDSVTSEEAGAKPKPLDPK